MIRYIYMALVGFLISNVVVMGISAFYPIPEQPESPTEMSTILPYPAVSIEPDYYAIPQPIPTGIPSSKAAMSRFDVSPTPNPETIAILRKRQEENNRRIMKQQEEYNAKVRKYNADLKAYDENSMKHSEYSLLLYVGAAVLFAVAGLLLLKRLPIIAEGLVVGSVILLYYYVDPWGTSASGEYLEFSPLGFGIVAVGFIITLVAGYFTLVKSQNTPKPTEVPKKI